ncbi:DNA ligase [Zoogloea sp.]|uniref:DNA ligase n=1 Tax=Zoogloea sp. TaxID=49181 RepID=UPI002611B74B|nr:DNA ligase [Zoogloea sp.]MDD3352218.1 DNA ligase [Zoogloea sp.]
MLVLAVTPAVGTAAPLLLLAETLKGAVAPADYWVSEKLDGVRALWDGKVLRFRSGNVVPAPDWFVAGLPRQHSLDGELWLGRGRFEALSATVRRLQPDDEAWRQVRYMVFELPGAPGDFTARVEAIRLLVERSGTPWLQAVEQFRIADRPALQTRLEEVVREGGEGLMLHRADAPYLTGRSDVLLKLKPQQDAEAIVVAHLPGKGRLTGLLGALVVETPEGRRFRIGTGFTDAERRSPPPVGSQITYRYRQLTRDGVPRFASFLRPREAF